MPLSRKFQRAQGGGGGAQRPEIPGRGPKAPARGFSFGWLPGAFGPWEPPNAAAPLGRASVPQGRKPSPPHPGRISRPAESVFQEEPQPETQPFAHVPGPLASNLWEGSAAPPGSGCPAWDGAGGAAAFGGPGAEGPRACQTKRAGPGARSFRALRALPPPPRRHPRQGSSRFPPAEAGAKAAGFRQ